ncbi:DUF6966 domain-containing protein [Ruania halotolerans]|uniref:DUF6966 domain-containing protein n=1 Tax=Ruania halotolerans TaxID=2897773 RepID=UPI001E388DD5|nr:hypothetical protein [Ruania halotolerans]UFU08251.1 hypothetical protein LQF10_09220 [Ruania halotolerans]
MVRLGKFDAAESPDVQIDALLTDLEYAVAILERAGGPDGWIRWLKSDHDRICARDIYGLDHLLSAFGGMGSFNDVVLHSMNGNRGSDEELVLANEHLRIVRSRIWDRAKVLLREYG